MKIKLTEPWARFVHSKSSYAIAGTMHLYCSSVIQSTLWQGSVSISGFTSRQRSYRKSEARAKQDAQELAVELLRDIRDGTKMLMERYDMGEDD